MSLIECKECGKEISNKAKKCPNCGITINHLINKKIVIIISFIILILIISVGYFYSERQKFKKLLLKDWQRVEKGSSGSYYTLELDFDETTINYNFNSVYSWLNSTLKKYDYKVINSHKLVIDDKKYKIEFNEDKTMMTITPSLTDLKEKEYWFNHN